MMKFFKTMGLYLLIVTGFVVSYHARAEYGGLWYHISFAPTCILLYHVCHFVPWKTRKQKPFRFLSQNSKVTCISKKLFQEYGNKFLGEGRLDDLSERVNWPSGISVDAGFVYHKPDLFHISNNKKND